jgi:hypothetical protein
LLDAGCAAATTVPLAYDPQCEGETVELFATSYNIYVPIGSVTLANGATINRTTASWLGLDKVHIDYSNVPPEVTDTSAYLALPAATGDLIPVAESGDRPDSEHYVGLVLDIPPLVPDTLLVHVFDSPTGSRVVYERIDSWPGNRQFDASSLAPAPPQTLVDGPMGQVHWGSGQADADAYWSSTNVQVGTTIVHWNAFGPGGATQVTYPVLPPELANITPNGTSTWSPPQVILAALSDFDYASLVEIVDRDISWWYEESMYLPPGALSLTATATP